MLQDKEELTQEESLGFGGEAVVNYEQKVCLCLVLDTSGSMMGAAINELNAGLALLKQEIVNDPVAKNRLEVAIVTFGDTAKTAMSPQLIAEATVPILTANGGTPFIDGVNQAIDLVTQRKKYYAQNGIPYFRPMIVVITDGEPSDETPDRKTALIERLTAGYNNKNFEFFGIGVQGYRKATLDAYCIGERKSAELKGFNFQNLFKWLSTSVQLKAQSQDVNATVAAPNPSGWMSF